MDAAEDLARVVGTAPACVALTVNRASLYRRRRGHPETSRRRPMPSRALAEREVVVHQTTLWLQGTIEWAKRTTGCR